MNARPVKIQKDIQQLLAKERRNAVVQTAAVIFWTLSTSEGFGEKRLRRLMHEVTGTSEDMDGVGFVPPFTSNDCLRYLKEKYGIDLDAEINLEE